jgi:hypothetical protein
MTTDSRKRAVSREEIQSLLSDGEIARVSRAEGGARLVEGDEYIDLEDVAGGVHQVHATSIRPDRALPRSAVSEATWAKIVAAIARGAG